MPSTIERWPLNQLAILSFSTLSMMRATSSSFTGAPLRQATTTLRYSAAFSSCPEACSVTLWFGPVSVPTGTLELARATAVRMSSSESPRAAAASGSTCTRTANFCAP